MRALVPAAGARTVGRVVGFYPILYTPHSRGHSNGDVLGGLLFTAGMVGSMFASFWIWVELRFLVPAGWSADLRRAQRFRSARQVDATGAREDEVVAIRVRVTEPPGGLVPGWGEAGAAWTRLTVEAGTRGVHYDDGEILVEDAAGSVISVEPSGLSVSGLTTPDVEESLRCASGTEDKLPPRIAGVLREKGFAFEGADGTPRWLRARAEQLVPGESLWLIGPVRRLGGPSAGHASGSGDSVYRDHPEVASFVSEGRARALVRAATVEYVAQLLEAGAKRYFAHRRRLAAAVVTVVASVATVVYAFAK